MVIFVKFLDFIALTRLEKIVMSCMEEMRPSTAIVRWKCNKIFSGKKLKHYFFKKDIFTLHSIKIPLNKHPRLWFLITV